MIILSPSILELIIVTTLEFVFAFVPFVFWIKRPSQKINLILTFWFATATLITLGRLIDHYPINPQLHIIISKVFITFRFLIIFIGLLFIDYYTNHKPAKYTYLFLICSLLVLMSFVIFTDLFITNIPVQRTSILGEHYFGTEPGLYYVFFAPLRPILYIFLCIRLIRIGKLDADRILILISFLITAFCHIHDTIINYFQISWIRLLDFGYLPLGIIYFYILIRNYNSFYLEIEKFNVQLKREIEKEYHIEEMLKESLRKEKETNEFKTRFISTTSHEFRTPLASISSSTEMLQRYGNKWDVNKKEEHFNRILGSVDYLVKLLEEILIISKADSGKINYTPKQINLVALCQEIIDEISIYKNAAHSISFIHENLTNSYMLDEKLIRLILINLLSNAFKYSPNGGNISLSVIYNQDVLTFIISDEGIGIPVEDHKNLFEPFYRCSNSNEIKGSGLGLSIVKRAVDLHNGEIEFKSEINKGTQFVISIPLLTK